MNQGARQFRGTHVRALMRCAHDTGVHAAAVAATGHAVGAQSSLLIYILIDPANYVQTAFLVEFRSP